MLADDGFVLDGFSAERALHQTDRRFLLRLSASSSPRTRISSSRTMSRFRARSSRSASSEAGTAMSREHEPHTSAFEAFSRAQNGQIAGMPGGNLQNRIRTATGANIAGAINYFRIFSRNLDAWLLSVPADLI